MVRSATAKKEEILREKRRYRRVTIAEVSRCNASIDIDDYKIEDAPVVSLSAGGAFLSLQADDLAPLQIGQRIREITFHNDDIEQIKPAGVIVYKLDRDQLQGIGVAFSGLPGPQIRALDSFVNDELSDSPLFDQ